MTKIISFTGHAGAGKSTAATIAASILGRRSNSAVQRFSLAGEVKNVARHLFGWEGDKESYMIADELDISRGRGLLVHIGERMKDAAPTVWIDFLLRSIYKFESDNKGKEVFIILDDMRFIIELTRFSEVSAENEWQFWPATLIREKSEKKEGPNDLTHRNQNLSKLIQFKIENDKENQDLWNIVETFVDNIAEGRQPKCLS